MVEAKADSGEIKVVVFGPGKGRGCARGIEEVTHHGLGIEGGGAVIGVCFGRYEARVVGFSHVLAQVDADELSGVAGEDVGDGAGPAGVVEDSDPAGGGGFECGGWVDEVDTEPREVRE